jgi:LysR family transcriptional regulator for bpeEF and oprC
MLGPPAGAGKRADLKGLFSGCKRSKMDRFDQLRTFVRVADLGSFSRAADDLERSRALVSQQVAALERRLGARLLNRTTRRVGLTGEGVEYLQRVRRILAEVEAADEAIMLTRERPQGRLRVDVPTAFGRHLLIPALPAFTRQYPQLTLEVQLDNRVVDLVAAGVDVALRVGPVGQGGLVARRIATMRLLTCASPGYLAQAGVPRSIEELRGHRCIGVLSPQTGRMRDWVFQRGRSRLRLRPACALSFNLPEAVISAGIADGGVLQTVDLLVGGAIASGRLRQVLPEHAADGPPISVVCLPAARHSAKVRVFSDFAARLLRDWSQRMHARPGA